MSAAATASKNYFAGFVEDLNLPDRRNLYYDCLVIFLFLALRSLFFHKFLISALYGPEVGCEIQMYSQVAADLAAGKYFYPIIHGYGIPFMFHYLIGILASYTGEPIAATGQFQFYMDCFVVPATYLFGCMAGNRKIALIATWLVCFSPIYTAFAMIITVASSVFHVYGFIFLFHAVKRKSFFSACVAGFLFGMPDGGGRFSPFIVASGLVTVWLMLSEKKLKIRMTKWLIAGWMVSMLPLFAYSIHSPIYLISLFYAFSGKGFAHVVMSRSLLDGIFAKAFEFTLHFFLFNPLCAVFLIAGLILTGVRLARKEKDISFSEKFALINVGTIAFFLTFVVTHVEPSELTGIPSRPLRYYFIFMPFLEIIGAGALLSLVERGSGIASRFFAFFCRRTSASVAAILFFVLGILAPAPYSDDKTFEEYEIGQNTTVLANVAPRNIYRYFDSYSFTVPYTEMLELYPDLPEGKKLKPMEFYARLMFSEPLRQEYVYQGIHVSWRPWFLNMPMIRYDHIRDCGKTTGLTRDVIVYMMEKRELRNVQHRYRERTFSETFINQMDDWELMKSLYPEYERYVIKSSEVLTVLKIPVPHVQYNAVVFQFDRRDLKCIDCDFVVPSTLVYIDEIGFGWRTSANLSDPGDWVNAIDKNQIDAGIRVSQLVCNDFSLRSEPGSYEIALEWKPEDGVTAIPFGFSYSAITAPIETVELETGRQQTTVRLNADNKITINLATGRQFVIYRLAVKKVGGDGAASP